MMGAYCIPMPVYFDNRFSEFWICQEKCVLGSVIFTFFLLLISTNVFVVTFMKILTCVK